MCIKRVLKWKMIKILFYLLLIVGTCHWRQIQALAGKLKSSLCHSNEITFIFLKQSVAMSSSVISVLFIKSFTVRSFIFVGCKKMKIYYFCIRNSEKYPLQTKWEKKTTLFMWHTISIKFFNWFSWCTAATTSKRSQTIGNIATKFEYTSKSSSYNNNWLVFIKLAMVFFFCCETHQTKSENCGRY